MLGSSGPLLMASDALLGATSSLLGASGLLLGANSPLHEPLGKCAGAEFHF